MVNQAVRFIIGQIMNYLCKTYSHWVKTLRTQDKKDKVLTFVMVFRYWEF